MDNRPLRQRVMLTSLDSSEADLWVGVAIGVASLFASIWAFTAGSESYVFLFLGVVYFVGFLMKAVRDGLLLLRKRQSPLDDDEAPRDQGTSSR